MNESGELAELVLRLDVDAVREVALPHALRAHEELVDRAGDRARQRQPHHQRHELDDEKEERDHDDDQRDSVAEQHAADLDRLRAASRLNSSPRRKLSAIVARSVVAGGPVRDSRERDPVGRRA